MRSDGKVDQGGAIRRTSRDPFGNGYIHSDQDDQEWKVQRRGNYRSQRSFPRKDRAATEGADWKLANADLFMQICCFLLSCMQYIKVPGQCGQPSVNLRSIESSIKNIDFIMKRKYLSSQGR